MVNEVKIVNIKTSADMEHLGAEMANACDDGTTIYLYGNLGVGKTTFTRGFLRGFGYDGYVPSPTFSLFERYQLSQGRIVIHFDLYRLKDAEELEYVGAAEYFDGNNICLVEWPSLGAGFLPNPDISCDFCFSNDDSQRMVNIISLSNLGNILLSKFDYERLD